jgi:hypothetical protein
MACYHLPSVTCPECVFPAVQPSIQPPIQPTGPQPFSPPHTGTLNFPSNWSPPIMQIPHRCPVCEGRGSVAEDFYPDDPPFPEFNKTHCRTCLGAGILWR